MIIEKRIEAVISEPLDTRGYDIVRIKYSAKILQIMIERKGGTNVSVGDCEKVSKLVSTLLDVEDIISDKYYLEVSSPGLDRPLVKLQDFERFKGEDTKISLFDEINTKKKIKGKIVAVEDNVIYVKSNDDDQELKIAFDNIYSANLIAKIDFNKK